MSNQVTGRLVYIGQPQEIPSKSGGNPFVKREFILDATTHDPYTGERSQYENILPLEVSGDKCAELDQYRIGDVITVSFAFGQVKRMVSIRCYKLEARRPVQQVAQAAQPVQPTVQPVPQPTYQQFPPPVDANGEPKDDLPF